VNLPPGDGRVQIRYAGRRIDREPRSPPSSQLERPVSTGKPLAAIGQIEEPS